jgi:hypothetical protein
MEKEADLYILLKVRFDLTKLKLGTDGNGGGRS